MVGPISLYQLRLHLAYYKYRALNILSSMAAVAVAKPNLSPKPSTLTLNPKPWPRGCARRFWLWAQRRQNPPGSGVHLGFRVWGPKLFRSIPFWWSSRFYSISGIKQYEINCFECHLLARGVELTFAQPQRSNSQVGVFFRNFNGILPRLEL